MLFRPGYECELAVVSNADFGTGTDFGHAALGGAPSSASAGVPSPRIPSALLSGIGAPGRGVGGSGSKSDGTTTPEGRRAQSAGRGEGSGSDPVEIWDVRRGYIAKWVVSGAAIEGGVTGESVVLSLALFISVKDGRKGRC